METQLLRTVYLSRSNIECPHGEGRAATIAFLRPDPHTQGKEGNLRVGRSHGVNTGRPFVVLGSGSCSLVYDRILGHFRKGLWDKILIGRCQVH